MSMTTEQIKKLKDEADLVECTHDYTAKLLREAADTIEQLAAKVRAENNVSQPCEDAISRRTAINLIRGCNSALQEPRIFDTHNSGVIFEHYVTELPPVNPQVKTGHWINHYDEDAKEGWYECDCCHTERAFNTDFCPDCGCRMVEPQERSE